MALKIKQLSSFPRDGRTMFVYTVSGTKAEIEDYKEVVGDNLKHQDDDDTKAPLFFTYKFAGVQGQLTKSKDWGYVIDRSEENTNLAVMAKYTGTPLEKEMARRMADREEQRMFGKVVTQQAVETPTPEPTPQGGLDGG